MANRPAAPLELREGDRQLLIAMTRSPTVQAGLAQRARILLLAAEGHSNTAIADRMGVSRPTVLAWRQRYDEAGLDGLVDRSRPGRVPQASAADVLAATLRPPPRHLGVVHWSSRLLGEHLGVGRGTVTRAWQSFGVQPVRGGLRFAVTPGLAGRVVAVLALRVGPPESLVLVDVRPAAWAGRVDDSAAASALPGLHAALRQAVQQALPLAPADPASDLLGLLDAVNRARAAWPTASRLHLVADGSGPVSLPALREALAVRSRISVHTVREPGRWPGLVAAFLATAALGRGGPSAVQPFADLRRRLAPDEVFAWCHGSDQQAGEPPASYATVK